MRQNQLLGLITAIGVLFTTLLGLSGCGEQAPSSPVRMITQRQLVDQLMIALEVPERPLLLTEQNLRITLTDSRGQPVDGAAVWLALMMPSMQMGPNEPDATAAGGGHYHTTALFTMSGTWHLEVHATVQGKEYIALFHAATQ